MSEWKVALAFVEGGSKKFWRARVEGETLYVNYGRIGAAGQTQVKDFPSSEAAEKELAKLEREKRKKGYEDEVSSNASESAPPKTKSKSKSKSDDDDEDRAEAGTEDVDYPGEDDTVEVVRPAGIEDPGFLKLAAAAGLSFVLEAEGRKVELELTVEGSELRTVVTERYASPKLAKEAFDRLAASMADEGYRRK